jgi:hypothetical protein
MNKSAGDVERYPADKPYAKEEEGQYQKQESH